MKVEILSANKLKITLTDNDLSDFDIDLDEICYDAEKAGDFFWNLLSDVDEDIDFFRSDCRIVIEALAAEDNAFVMIITRVDDNDGYKYTRAKARKKRSTTPVLLYSFDDITEASQGCKRISMYYSGKSSLYKLDKKYYLAICGTNDFIARDSDVLLSDYGNRVKDVENFEGVLAEKGEFLIKEDAVEILCSYF